jgi:diguanylate cyclase (GGDEF)-like protein/PAS domain S-box-containing protein
MSGTEKTKRARLGPGLLSATSLRRSLGALVLGAAGEVLAVFLYFTWVVHEAPELGLLHVALLVLFLSPLAAGVLVWIFALRRRAGWALSESEERYRDLTDSLPQPIFELDERGCITFGNPVGFTLFGYSPEDLSGGLTALQLIAPEDRERARDNIRKILRGETGAGNEYIAQRKDGRRFPVAIYSVPIRRQGEPARLRGMMMDLTEHKGVEEELRLSQARLALRNRIARVFLTHPGEEMYAETLGVVLEALKSRHGAFGYINDEGDFVCPSLTRDIWEQCQVPDKSIVFPREAWGGLWGRALTEKRVLVSSGNLRVPPGHIPIERALAAPIFFQEKVIGLLLVGNKAADYAESDRDLLENIALAIAPILHARLERDRAEAGLRSSEMRYRRLFEAAQDGLLILEPHTGEVTDVNPFLTQLLGYSREEFLGRKLWEIGPFPDEAARATFRELREKGYSRHDELWLAARDGRLIPVECVRNVFPVDHREIVQCNIRDISPRKQLEDRLRYLATHDPLTDLPNRELFHDRLSQFLAQARRYQRRVTVMMLDLDDFKRINDSLGHPMGDRVLRAVAGRLSGLLRESDSVARLGGDEFMFILEGVADPPAAEALARKILTVLGEPLYLEGREFRITGSIGITLFPDHGEEVDSLIRNVDIAMYRAKETRNSFQLYTPEAALTSGVPEPRAGNTGPNPGLKSFRA